MKIIVAHSVEAAVKTLDADDRRRAFAWFNTLENWDNDEFTRNKSHRLVDGKNLYALRSSSDFRIIFSLEKDCITILDIVRRDTLAQFKSLQKQQHSDKVSTEEGSGELP